jgi:meiotic recombination protein DMC1
LFIIAERQQVLGKTLSRMLKIAEQFNVAVFMTNQVMSDPGGSSAFVMDTRKPVGGNIIAHASTTRLYFRKGKGDQRVCKIYDSPMLPESEATFQLGEGGITDPE